jgi:hypothetical protein
VADQTSRTLDLQDENMEREVNFRATGQGSPGIYSGSPPSSKGRHNSHGEADEDESASGSSHGSNPYLGVGKDDELDAEDRYEE